MKYNEKHQEIHDGKPVAIPAGFKHPPSIQDLIRRAIRQEISQGAKKEGHETFDEADDFDVDDDPELKSPYELDDNQANAKFMEERPDERKVPDSDPGQQKSRPGNKNDNGRKRKADNPGNQSTDEHTSEGDKDSPGEGE